MIAVRITPAEQRSASSAAQMKFMIWDKLAKAGIPMPAFSLLHCREADQFKPTSGAMFQWNHGSDIVFEWSA